MQTNTQNSSAHGRVVILVQLIFCVSLINQKVNNNTELLKANENTRHFHKLVFIKANIYVNIYHSKCHAKIQLERTGKNLSFKLTSIPWKSCSVFMFKV